MHAQSSTASASQDQSQPHQTSASSSRRTSIIRNNANSSRHSIDTLPSNITPASTDQPTNSLTTQSPRQSATTSTTPPQSSSRPRTATKRFHVKSYDEEAFQPFTLGDEGASIGPLQIPSRPTSGRGGKSNGTSRPTSGRIRSEDQHQKDAAPSFNSYKQRSLNELSDKESWQRRNVQYAPLKDKDQEQTGRSLITLVGRSERKGDVPTAAALARAADGGEYRGSVVSVSERGGVQGDRSRVVGGSRKVAEEACVVSHSHGTNKSSNAYPSMKSQDFKRSDSQPITKRNPPPPLSTSPHPSNTSAPTIQPHQQPEKYAPPGAGPTPSRTRTRPTTFGKSNRIAFLHSVQQAPHFGGLGLTSAGAAGEERILRVPTVFAGWKKGDRSLSDETPLPMGDRRSSNPRIPSYILDHNPDAPRSFKELLIFDKNVKEMCRSTKPNIPTRPLALSQDPGPLTVHTRYGANTEWYRDTTVTVQPQVGTNHYLSDTDRFSYQVPMYKCPPPTHVDPRPR
ncbi:hypothetical protein HK097_007833 [Rhizophlyctis rosea]|uniref:Uncharacterized protein n=1 Tax=Rhizophlyctis rosea TaxID=64517 RepID=A0AAD5X5P1_9FUNG|nr:hypothetical protein HK097_007833 [Rhizophlyctis rosea]